MYYYPSEILGRFVSAVVGIIQLGLSVRFILELFGANAGTPFVAWIYAITQPLVAPFAAMFPSLSLGGFVFDTSLVVAMIAYALLGWLVVSLFNAFLSFGRPYEPRTTI
jgi:YggT family protein